jgi:glutamate synthase (NADPH/NADH) large chain
MTGGIVLCLGQIGRNFAAGMSGGIAYVYNPQGDLKLYLNSEMVETRKIVPEGINDKNIPKNVSKIIQNMLDDDEIRLKFLLKKHVFYTDSSKAKNILENWDKLSRNFVKITPLDFKRVLLEKEKNSFIKL